MKFQISPGREVRRAISINNTGSVPVAYRVVVDPEGSLRFTTSSGIAHPGLTQLQLEIPPDPPPAPRISLITRDSPPPAEDPWAGPQDRTHEWRPVSFEAAEPPELRVFPRLVMFNGVNREREVELRNSGGDDLVVTLPRLPDGVIYRSVGHHEGVTLSLRAGERLSVPLACSLGAASGNRPVTFVSTDGNEEVMLHIPQHSDGSQLPAFVVGVDFGTRNSSVFVRRIGRNGHDDEIVPNLDKTDGSVRFPSALYRTSAGEWFAGDEAVKEAEKRGAFMGDSEGARVGKSIFIRNMKRFLYQQDEPYGDETDIDLRRVNLIKRFLVFVRERAVELMRTRWGEVMDEVEVLFVFSLPILDEKLQESMRQKLLPIVRDVFLPRHRQHEPDEQWVRFADEPVCAALHIMDRLGPNGGRKDAGSEAEFHLNDGQRIVVFDSGGGTTDVVVGRVGLSHARLSLEVEHRVGLDSQADTFGGNDVSKELMRVLIRRVELMDRWRRTPQIEQILSQNQNPDENLARNIKILDSMLAEQLDPLKIAAVDGQEGKSGFDLIGITDWCDGKEVAAADRRVTAVDVNSAAQVGMSKVMSRINSDLFQPGTDSGESEYRLEDIAYVFPVGGNTLIPAIISELRRAFSADSHERVRGLNPVETMAAVGRGAVLFPDARVSHSADYSVALWLDCGNERELLWKSEANASPVLAAIRRDRRFVAGSMILRLVGQAEGIEGQLLEEVIEPVPGQSPVVRLFIRPSGEPDGLHLRVRYSYDADQPEDRARLMMDYRI